MPDCDHMVARPIGPGKLPIFPPLRVLDNCSPWVVQEGMSQRFAEMVVPAHTEKCLVERTCDICKKKAQRPGAGHWVAYSSYDVSKTTISCEEGASYPEGYNTSTLSFDICPDCFKAQLVPFMRLFGAEPRTSGEE
jgi:hypothetical protein